jgi:hypothetical protein
MLQPHSTQKNFSKIPCLRKYQHYPINKADTPAPINNQNPESTKHLSIPKSKSQISHLFTIHLYSLKIKSEIFH